MSAEAAALVARMKTLSGYIRRVDTASSSDSANGRRCRMIQIGDLVVYVKDGAKGVVIHAEEDRFQILWEDDFVSWEKSELLRVTPYGQKQ